MNAHNEQQWPEYLMLRDTGLSDDAGGLGQRIFTTAGAGYVKQKYVRADLSAQPSPVVKQNLTTQPAAAQEVGYIEFLDAQNHSLRRAIHAIMKKLAFLLDEDQFADIDSIALAAGAAPVTAAPANDLHAHLLHMLGAKDHEDAGRIIGELHAATMRTPAAPGIDLEHFHRAVQRICIKFDGDLPYISGIAEVLDLIDAAMQAQAGDAEVQP